MKNIKPNLLLLILFGLIAFIMTPAISFGYEEDWNNYVDQTVLKYPFYSNEGTTIYDRSGRGNNATNYNAGNLTGKIGNALYFDGINDYVAINPMSLDATRGITISAWAKFYNTNSWSRIIEFGTGAATHNIIFGNEGTTKNLAIALWDPEQGTKQISAPNAIKTNEWCHYAATIDATGLGSLYVNGIRVYGGQLYLPTTTDWTTNYLGRSSWSGDGYFSGFLDEVLVVERSLTSYEIQTLYKNSFKRMEYRMDENSGVTTCYDTSGNDFHGTYSESCPRITGQIGGAIQASRYLEGEQTHVQIPSITLNCQTGLTIEAWVDWRNDPYHFNDWGRIIEFGNGAASDNIIFGTEGTSNNLLFEVYNNTTSGGRVIASNVCNVNDTSGWSNFAHYAAVIDATGYVKLYKNGVVVGSGYTAVPRQIQRRTNYIGKSSWSGDRTRAAIDSVLVHERMLSDAELKAHYQEGYLWANYNFDNNISGSYLYDKTENNLNGVIYGPECVPSGTHYALDFDGVNDYVKLPNFNASSNYGEDIMISDGFTIESWVYYRAVNNFSRIVELSVYDQSANRYYSNILFGNIGTSKDLFFEVYNTSGVSGGQVIASNAISLNCWLYFVVTAKRKEPGSSLMSVKIYRNGTLYRTGETALIQTDGACNYTFNRNYIGRSTWSGDGYFNGKINYLKIHRRVLTDSEVLANWNRNKDTNY